MSMDAKNKIVKFSAIASFTILFSTNYYGGNALFFLGDESLFVARAFFATVGIVLLAIYFILKQNAASKLIERNDRIYTQDVIEKMDCCGLNDEIIEEAIKNGVKKDGRSNTYYSYSNKDIKIFTVVLNNKGYVVEVFNEKK